MFAGRIPRPAMPLPSKTSRVMRLTHRYLGFFLAGVMAVYAISGMVLIFRDTDFLKRETAYAKTIATGLDAEPLGKEIGVRNLKVDREEAGVLYFKEGRYDSATGEAAWTKKELPFVLNQMTHLHKAKSADPLYYFNIVFGASLLFFVLSSFWMFMPGSDVFRKGLWYTLGGMVLVLVLLFV